MGHPSPSRFERSTRMSQGFFGDWRMLVWSASILGGAVICSLILHSTVFFLVRRIAARRPTELKHSLIRNSERLSRWILPMAALLAVLPASALPDRIMQ